MRFHLELTDPGFDHTVLSEFRTRLVALTAEERFLEAVLTLCKEHGWLKARGRQRTDSTHILAKIRAVLATLNIRSGNKCFENDIIFFHCLQTREGKGKIRSCQAIFML
jgi:hypothetical protein